MTEGTIPVPSENLDFEIDPELLEPGHNQVRRLILPYGIVINEQVAGILIPEDQLEKANWFVMSTEEEMTTIGLTEDVTGLLDVRNLALIGILRGGGLRCSELIKLELKHYNKNTGALEIHNSKRGKDRTVYLPEGAISLLEQWLVIRGNQPGPLLCPIRKGG